jgi:hypothetical protein
VTNLCRSAERVVAFYNGRGTAEQWIKEGKNAVRWTRLSCRSMQANAARLQLHALAYNLANFLRTLALPKEIERWSLTTLRETVVKIGAKVVAHARYTIFQMAEVAVPLHLAAGAIDRLVEMPRLGLAAAERGDDEARVGLALGPFRLADDAARAAPAVQRRPGEVLETAGGLAGALGLALRRRQLGSDLGDEALVLGKTEEIVDPVRLAPRHELLAAEAGVGTQQDAHPGPAFADLADDARHLRPSQKIR